ncbi:MAG TPA: hypothetical protein PKA64_11450, partial [Myxococcota bacterium]|nr:hypothetical protein [Myxococcota bacterium]
WFPWLDGGLGRGPCPPALRGRCVDIRGSVVEIGRALSAGGVAEVTFSISAGYAAPSLAVQAIYLDGPIVLSAPLEVPVWRDDDHDGLGAPEDCDDQDPAVTTGSTWYADADADGWGDPATALMACAPGPGLVTNGEDCDDQDPAVHPGGPGCAVASCAEAQALRLPSGPTRVRGPSGELPMWCDMTTLDAPVGFLTGAQAALDHAAIVAACPAGTQPYRYLTEGHVDAAMAYVHRDRAATYYLLNAFAGPAGTQCPAVANVTGWHEPDGTWHPDAVDLEARGLDIHENCSLAFVRDPVTLHVDDGPRSSAVGAVLYNSAESAQRWPVLCTEPDGWAP